MNIPIAFGQIGFQELLVVLLVILILFGGSRLPKLARSLGSSMTEFKKGLRGEPEEDAAKKIPAAPEKQETPKS